MTKKLINQANLTGERALFQAHDLHITNSVFEDGESPLKHGQNLAIDHTIFKWKYPLWYTNHATLNHTTWQPDAHAGIWYTKAGRPRRHLVYQGPNHGTYPCPRH